MAEFDRTKYPEIKELELKLIDARQDAFEKLRKFFEDAIPYDGTASHGVYRLEYSITEGLVHSVEVGSSDGSLTVNFNCNEPSERGFIVSGYSRSQHMRFVASEYLILDPKFINLIKTLAISFQRHKDEKAEAAVLENTKRGLESEVHNYKTKTDAFLKVVSGI